MADDTVTFMNGYGRRKAGLVADGVGFDKGFLSAYFVTSPDRMECVLEAPSILLYDKRISAMPPLLPPTSRCPDRWLATAS